MLNNAIESELSDLPSFGVIQEMLNCIQIHTETN
jgi:hypothetical protein